MSRDVASASVGLIDRLDDASQGRLAMYRYGLIGLWVGWFVTLFGGMLLGRLDADSHGPAWSRLVSSLLLVAAGWTWFSMSRGRMWERYALLIAIGMTFGFCGDVFNAYNVVIGGIVTFGIGHVAYIAACVSAGRVARLHSGAARYASLAAWMLFGVVSWYFVVYVAQKNLDLRWPALPYTLLLAGTAGMATSLAVQDRKFTLLALGAALFLVSDLVLAFRLFHEQSVFGGNAVWLLYGPGQMFIVYALAQARRSLEPVA